MGAATRSATQVLAWAYVAAAGLPVVLAGASQTTVPATSANRMVTEPDCTTPSLVATIAPEKIGEPVRSVTLQAAWVAATDTVPAHCRVDGVFAPVDTSPTTRPINFRVILPAANWVTPAKINAIRGEFVRQCDGLDGLADGITNNYMACRAMFDLSRGGAQSPPVGREALPEQRRPRSVRHECERLSHRRPDLDARVVYSHYTFASPLANGVREFGMWLPNTDPSGSGLILPARFRGQEGGPADAPLHSHLGVLGVTGFLMQDVTANPLDYVEGGPLNERRRFLSEMLDSTNPDFNAFARRGGKMIVAIGTNDTLASPGAQLDFYQSVIDTIGRTQVDRFARFFVMPQTGHGLAGTNYGTSGDGKTLPMAPVPNTWDRLALLFDWVERGVAPGMSITVSAGEKSLPLCSYPAYPRYVSGPVASASSYRCNQP